MVVIVDYKMGNVGSILNMLDYLSIEATVSSEAAAIRAAERLILPGVGAFDQGVRSLTAGGLVDVLNEVVVERKTPVLGICLGMQLMAESSEEGTCDGLSWFPARVRRFNQSIATGPRKFKVPNMGWADVRFDASSPLYHGFDADDCRFYFVHSYHWEQREEGHVSGRSFHGYEFTASVERENVYGVQFHPEKSHVYGMKLLKNFVERA